MERQGFRPREADERKSQEAQAEQRRIERAASRPESLKPKENLAKKEAADHAQAQQRIKEIRKNLGVDKIESPEQHNGREKQIAWNRGQTKPGG